MIVDVLLPIFVVMTMDLLIVMYLLDFETYRIILDMLRETLSLYDIVLDDETTQTGESRIIDEIDSSTRHPSIYR